MCVSGIIGHQNSVRIKIEFMLLQEYKLLFEGAGSNPGDKTLEDRFFEHEVSNALLFTVTALKIIIQ